MHSADTSAQPMPPLKPRDGSSAASPSPDGANTTMTRDTMTREIRLAVGQCVAEHHDGIEMVRRCARAARASGVKPEHVVLLIHAAWDDYTGVAGASADRDGLKRLRLTGVALDAYFGDD